tara:strand:+ start:521 stop:688 length:168 start_codon:yes stop_codon:yes gene_type:complete
MEKNKPYVALRMAVSKDLREDKAKMAIIEKVFEEASEYIRQRLSQVLPEFQKDKN